MTRGGGAWGGGAPPPQMHALSPHLESNHRDTVCFQSHNSRKFSILLQPEAFTVTLNMNKQCLHLVGDHSPP